jgi:GTP cyclohydrolase III
MYIQVQNELTATYNEIRNDVAQRRFDVSWQKLKQNDDMAKYKKMINKIKEDYPMKISEAEPENVGN